MPYSVLNIRSFCTFQLANSGMFMNDTSDSLVARDGVVWHVKGRLPSRGTMPVRWAIACRRSSSPAAFHEAPTNQRVSRTLSLLHSLMYFPPNHIHTHHTPIFAPRLCS
jgi:hypothetical protein